MGKVGIVTDSSSCLPKELVNDYGLYVAPNFVVIEGKAYRDHVDITTAEFWKKFRESNEIPKTSAVSPGDFMNIFIELSKTTDNIACVVLSQKLSATYTAAVQAKELMEVDQPSLNIEIVDSKTSIGALGFIVLEAARVARMGKSLSEVVETAQKTVPRAKYLLVLESAKYIMRIGRAPDAAKAVPEQQEVSPIMGIVKDTGLVDMLGSGKGTIDAQRKAVNMIKEYADTQRPLHAMLHYSENRKEISDLEQMITSEYNCSEVYVSEFSPVVVTALGPSVGLAFYS